MSFLPIIIDQGQLKQLPSGEALNAGGWVFPTAGGTENFVLTADGSGNAVWSQSLVGLALVSVDNITIDGASITSDTGAISFNDEDLTTTGDVSAKNVVSSGVLIGTKSDVNSDNRILSNLLSWKGPNANTIGTLKITLPVSWTSTMMTFRIRGYNYKSAFGGPWEIICGGYNYSSNWGNISTIVTGTNPPFSSVRYAYDGTNCCILIGDLSTPWDYPQIHVMDLTVGYDGQTSDFQGDWDAEIISSEAGITNIKYSRLHMSARKMLNDETIYVKTTGDDDVGVGSSGAPYLTLDRVMEHLTLLDIGSKIVTVDIGPGVYNHASILSFDHADGSQVVWDGDSESLTSQTTTSIDATDYTWPTDDFDFDYHEATITLTGKTLAAGDYILIYNASGGTNPGALHGCHRVESFIADVATIRIVHVQGTPKVSGAITFDCYLVRTVIAFSATSGIRGRSYRHLGEWTNLVVQGDPSVATCHNGFDLQNSGLILTSPVGIIGWRRGLFATLNSGVFCRDIFISGCYWFGLTVTRNSSADARGLEVSGCLSGIFCRRNAFVDAEDCNATGLGASGIHSADNSWVLFTTGTIKASLNEVLYAINGGGISAEAEDVSSTQVYYDSTATCSPARDTEGNGDAIMRGGPY